MRLADVPLDGTVYLVSSSARTFSPRTPRASSGAHLLVVDDEAAILSTLKTALSLEGYAVDVAGSIATAEERLAKGAYDLVLLDVALPDGDGVELLGRVRRSGSEVPAIMMSGHGTILDVE